VSAPADIDVSVYPRKGMYMPRQNFVTPFAFTMAALAFIICAPCVYALDCEVTRRTLIGIPGVNVVIEELQPGIRAYGQKNRLQREQMKADVEAALKKAGITVLQYDQWLKSTGKPFLYIVVNTHEYEKYWYSYDIRVELRQLVSLEANPAIKTIAPTWSVSMTGNTNIGRLNSIKDNLNVLLAKFAEAYLAVNQKDK
jgi:hypothetical protein